MEIERILKGALSCVACFEFNCSSVAATNHFEVFNLAVGESEVASVRSTYKALALAVHPDKNTQNKDRAQQAFIVLSNAFETLSSTRVLVAVLAFIVACCAQMRIRS